MFELMKSSDVFAELFEGIVVENEFFEMGEGAECPEAVEGVLPSLF